MSAQELAQEIESIVLSTTDAFADGVEKIQGVLYNRLLSVLKDLELDDDGYIKQSAVNRRILFEAENVINEYLPGESLSEAISRSLVTIPEIDNLNARYFKNVSDSFNPNRNFFKSLQDRTIQNIEGTLLEDGLTAQIKNPLVEILNQNINSGGLFSGFLEQVQNFVKGNEEIEGRILSYSRTYLRDTMFNYSRTFQQAITADLGLEFYVYSGGTMDTTRDFCKERHGKFFHHDEVIKWAKLSWQGKRQGTTGSSIFSFCGGYNCTHSLIPVDSSIVPESVLKRAKNEGYL
jgi:hypothetical protein